MQIKVVLMIIICLVFVWLIFAFCRDVKPGNYTIGRPELNELRKIYVLDFGMCRKFTNAQVNSCIFMTFS